MRQLIKQLMKTFAVLHSLVPSSQSTDLLILRCLIRKVSEMCFVLLTAFETTFSKIQEVNKYCILLSVKIFEVVGTCSIVVEQLLHIRKLLWSLQILLSGVQHA